MSIRRKYNIEILNFYDSISNRIEGLIRLGQN